MAKSEFTKVSWAAALSAGCVLAAVSCASNAANKNETELPPAAASSSGSGDTTKQPTAAAKSGTEVLLCDGQTKVTVPAGTPGTSVASSLMAEWIRKNPNANWEAEERERHTLQPSADNTGLVGQLQGQTYGRVTEQDVKLWKNEVERVATAGSAVFHSADELGSTVAVSCDMCHPHAANTHPETYPKYQAQLGRVVLLRDMINWCIEHPVRGQPLAADDSKLRALEAYILAQRKGKSLDYGRH
jgi:thiosulfate dehydrogenase